MLAAVRTEKYIHTAGCHPSPVLYGRTLNSPVGRDSVCGLKTDPNSSRGSRIPGKAPTCLDTHYSSIQEVLKTLCMPLLPPFSLGTFPGKTVEWSKNGRRRLSKVVLTERRSAFLPAMNGGVSCAQKG